MACPPLLSLIPPPSAQFRALGCLSLSPRQDFDEFSRLAARRYSDSADDAAAAAPPAPGLSGFAPWPQGAAIGPGSGGGGGGGGAPVFFFTPAVFRQANLAGFAAIVARAAALVGPARLNGAVACELYGGIGTIGLSLLALPLAGPGGGGGGLAELRCSDENPANARAFDMARRSLPPAAQGRASYLVGSALEALRAGEAEGADLVIVDPPRKGLEAEVAFVSFLVFSLFV